MLILELGVDAEDGWQHALEEGRQQWRLYQVGASVRDSPETAARVLRELGIRRVTAGGGQPPGSRGAAAGLLN